MRSPTPLLFVAFFLAGVGGHSAIAQPTREPSPEQDPAISKFQEADADSNGSISPDEMKAYLTAKVDWFKKHDEFLKKLDADQDGAISQVEFENRQVVLNQVAAGKEQPAVTEFADKYDQRYLNQKPKVGETIEDLTAYDEKGDLLDFEDLRGKYTVINFGCLT